MLKKSQGVSRHIVFRSENTVETKDSDPIVRQGKFTLGDIQGHDDGETDAATLSSDEFLGGKTFCYSRAQGRMRFEANG